MPWHGTGRRLGGTLACTPTSKEEDVSDHLDAPGLQSPNMDARVDITDVFAFHNPADPTSSVLVLNVNPVAPTVADSFAPGAAYDLILDTDGVVADIVCRVTYSPRETGDQRATVRPATGEEARPAEVSGEVLFRENAPLAAAERTGIYAPPQVPAEETSARTT